MNDTISNDDDGAEFSADDTAVDRSSQTLVLFEAAREHLRKTYATRGAIKELYPLFSPATLTRLLKDEADYKGADFSAAIRERLVWLFDTQRQSGTYNFIEQLMGHTEIGRSIIFRDFVGDYALFRFALTPPLGYGQTFGRMPSSSLNLSFVKERITIFKDEINEPAYSYFNHETHKDGIVIKGAVFYALGHLFMPGLSQDLMSLAIVSASRATGWMHGFWSSVGKRGAGSPYSARFLLVDEKRTDIIERLSGKKAEDTFFEMTGGNYAYYMSI